MAVRGRERSAISSHLHLHSVWRDDADSRPRASTEPFRTATWAKPFGSLRLLPRPWRLPRCSASLIARLTERDAGSLPDNLDSPDADAPTSAVAELSLRRIAPYRDSLGPCPVWAPGPVPVSAPVSAPAARTAAGPAAADARPKQRYDTPGGMVRLLAGERPGRHSRRSRRASELPRSGVRAVGPVCGLIFARDLCPAVIPMYRAGRTQLLVSGVATVPYSSSGSVQATARTSAGSVNRADSRHPATCHGRLLAPGVAASHGSSQLDRQQT